MSFRREKYVPRGGPNGGDGGKGGDVIFKADSQITTLLDFRYQQHYHANRGQHGKGKNQEGRSASPLILPLPVGTIVRDAASGEILRDFTKKGETFIVAQGGWGGRGNAHFATPTLQAPRHAEPGQTGEERWLLLELKLMADVGIVGFPNVGKSTLISKISSVRPKIADYPFTTLVPHLGVVNFEDHKPLVVADIPGIITGAHEGTGLGLRFLRHIERTSLLLHLLDISGNSQRDPIEDYLALNRELSLFSPKLAAKPQVVALNKIDMPEASRNLIEVRRYFKKIKKEVYPISALTGEGLPSLL
ncbi:MAG: GTPase ObgE, partial [Deltaproteobacteria bacterium]|nr:GTPase ObgE [Deltaproteobacteria bacterium]